MITTQDNIATIEVSVEELRSIDSMLEKAESNQSRATDTYAAVFYQPGLRTGEIYAGYEIGPVIGSGGLAEVREAVHIATGEKRAIKYPRQDMQGIYGKVLDEAFRREADLLQRLDHPNIVKGYEPFEYKGSIHIPLEYLETDLGGYLGKAPSLERLCDFMKQAVQPLKHLRENRIVHCDIKPQQYLVDSNGTVKLTDFGSARSEGEEATNELMMTPTYFPLHIINQPKIKFNHSIDLYAFGKSIVRIMLSTLGVPKDEISELTRRGDDEECLALLKKADVPKYLLNSIINSCLLSVDENSNFNAFDLEQRIDVFRAGLNKSSHPYQAQDKPQPEPASRTKDTVRIRADCAVIVDSPPHDD